MPIYSRHLKLRIQQRDCTHKTLIKVAPYLIKGILLTKCIYCGKIIDNKKQNTDSKFDNHL